MDAQFEWMAPLLCLPETRLFLAADGVIGDRYRRYKPERYPFTGISKPVS